MGSKRGTRSKDSFPSVRSKREIVGTVGKGAHVDIAIGKFVEAVH